MRSGSTNMAIETSTKQQRRSKTKLFDERPEYAILKPS
jgi:hypothetical protein